MVIHATYTDTLPCYYLQLFQFLSHCFWMYCIYRWDTVCAVWYAYMCACVCVSEKVTCNMNEWEVFFFARKKILLLFLHKKKKNRININLSIEREYVLLKYYQRVSCTCEDIISTTIFGLLQFQFVFFFFLLRFRWMYKAYVCTYIQRKCRKFIRVKHTSLASRSEIETNFNWVDCNWFSCQNVCSSIDISHSVAFVYVLRLQSSISVGKRNLISCFICVFVQILP